MAKQSTKALATTLEFNDDQITLLKNTVAKGCTDNEFMLFMHIATTYGLDPLVKEIWALKYSTSQPATIFTSRDGYLKIASRDPQMDGLQSDVVCANDTLNKTTEGGVQHSYGVPRGAIIGAYALVYRKDRSRPAYFYAPMNEYNSGSNPTWKKYPSAMIVKVAEACALKRAFSISGLVTHEEIGVDVQPQQEAETTAHVVVEAPVLALASVQQQEEIVRLLQHRCVDAADRNKMLASISRMDAERADQAITKLVKKIVDYDAEHGDTQYRMGRADNMDMEEYQSEDEARGAVD